jgi:hypothetical protein
VPGAVALNQRIGLGHRQHPAVELPGFRVLEPGGEAGGVRLASRRDRLTPPTCQPMSSERLARDLGPEPEAQDDQLELGRIASLLPDPAPVARGLLTGDPAFSQSTTGTPGGSDTRRSRPGDAAADDDDLRRRGRAVGGSNRHGRSWSDDRGGCSLHSRDEGRCLRALAARLVHVCIACWWSRFVTTNTQCRHAGSIRKRMWGR